MRDSVEVPWPLKRHSYISRLSIDCNVVELAEKNYIAIILPNATKLN